MSLVVDSCEGWFHSGCEKVSAVTYDFLSKHAEEKAIFWFCNCEDFPKRGQLVAHL